MPIGPKLWALEGYTRTAGQTNRPVLMIQKKDLSYQGGDRKRRVIRKTGGQVKENENDKGNEKTEEIWTWIANCCIYPQLSTEYAHPEIEVPMNCVITSL